MKFVFEAGFADQGQANRMMNNIFRSPQLHSFYQYEGHSFLEKDKCRPTQAADLLAWQWYKDINRRSKGLLKPRGDLAALLKGTPHFALHATADMLQELISQINARAGTPLGNEIAGIAVRNPDSPLFPKRIGEQGSANEYKKLMDQYQERVKSET